MTSLLHQISNSVKHWYLPLIIGVLFILFGIYIFTVPLETYLTLSIFFSASYIVSGLMDIFFSIGNNKTLKGWGWVSRWRYFYPCYRYLLSHISEYFYGSSTLFRRIYDAFSLFPVAWFFIRYERFKNIKLGKCSHYQRAGHYFIPVVIGQSNIYGYFLGDHHRFVFHLRRNCFGSISI